MRDWLFKHKYIVGSFVVFVFIFAIPAITFADPPTSTSSLSSLMSDPSSFAVNLFLGLLLTITNLAVALAGKLIVLLLGAIIIPILSYNNFGDSAVIAIGWPLVRDVVNMFVIVVLLVVAIQTIVGFNSSKWEQQLPQLFLAIVLVNFSKTICLLVVDVSQVVMFTFVNALRDIAAGNFMNLFQLNEFVSVGKDWSTGAISSQTPLDMTNLLMTSYATLALLGMVLGTLIILTVVFVYRIILLWVLIIISPIAFFMRGLKNIVSQAGKYQEWWSKFSAAAILGPVMTFFLWLGLAAASAGPIAVSEGMNFEGTSDVPTLLSGAFATDKFLSVIMGMILIMVGFKVSGESAGAMGGIAGKLINEDVGKKMFTGALKAPASFAYRGARGTAKIGLAAGKYAGVQAGRGLAQTKVGQDLAKSVTQIGAAVAKEGPMGRLLGGAIMGAGGKLEGAVSASRDAASEKARGQSASASNDEMQGRMGSYFDAAGNPIVPTLPSDQNRMTQDIFRLMTDKNLRKDLKKSMGDEKFEALMKNSMAHATEKEDDMTEDQKKSFKTLKAGRLRDITDDKDIDKALADDDFRVSQLSEEDMADERVQKALKNRATRTYIDEKGQRQTETLWDQVERGQGVSNKVRDAAQGVGATLNESSAAQIAQAIKHGHIDAGAITSADIADPARRREIAKAMAMSGVDVGAVGRTDPAARSDLLAELGSYRRNVVTSATAATDPAVRAQLEKHIAEIDRARFAAMAATTPTARNAAATSVGVDNGTGAIAVTERENVREIIKSQPTQIFKFDTAVQAAATANRPNEISKEIVRSLNQNMVKEMQNQFRKAKDSGDTEAAERIRQSTATIIKALDAELAGAGGNINDLDMDTKNMYRQFQNMERYTRP